MSLKDKIYNAGDKIYFASDKWNKESIHGHECPVTGMLPVFCHLLTFSKPLRPKLLGFH